MQNPILQLLLNANKQNKQNNGTNGNLGQRIQAIKSFLTGKDSTILYTQLLNTNPQFRQFVQDCEGKKIEDIALEYDIDLNVLKQFL